MRRSWPTWPQQVVSSYRQLPFNLYQIQTKFRDEPRPRAGLIRVREFTMKDAYTFDRDWPGWTQPIPSFYQAYFNIFRRCGLDAIAVESDMGMMGGTMAHEFMALTPIGEDTLLLCDECGYGPIARSRDFSKPDAHGRSRAPWKRSTRPASTPLPSLAEFLGHPRTSRRPRPSLWWPRSMVKMAKSPGTICLCRRARRYGTQRDQADQCRQGAPAATRPRGGDRQPSARRPATVRPSASTATRFCLVVDDLVVESAQFGGGRQQS